MCGMQSNRHPLISVVMGVRFPGSDVSDLQRAISSITEQSFSDFEFLICENGSSKQAKECLVKMAGEDRRIRLIDGTGAKTLTQKLNRCIASAQGEWIARMDDDDFSYANRFERQIAYLRKAHDCAFVGCCVQEKGGRVQSLRRLPETPQIRDFRITLPFVHPALMLKKEAVVLAGGYSEDPRQEGCDDYDLLLRLYTLGYRGANLQEVLLDYSIVSSQIKRRPYRLFFNEFVTRIKRFHALGLLPQWLPWAIKPLIAGLMPRRMLYCLKHCGE